MHNLQRIYANLSYEAPNENTMEQGQALNIILERNICISQLSTSMKSKQEYMKLSHESVNSNRYRASIDYEYYCLVPHICVNPENCVQTRLNLRMEFYVGVEAG